jgi:hypothetical protein
MNQASIIVGAWYNRSGLSELLACQEVKSSHVRAFLLSEPSIFGTRWYRTSAGHFFLLFCSHITPIRTSIGHSSHHHHIIKYFIREAMPPSVVSSDDDEVSYRPVDHFILLVLTHV